MSAADYTMVGRIVAGLVTDLSDSEFLRADCAPRATLGDGRITAADWTQCGRYVVGLDAPQQAGGPGRSATADKPTALKMAAQASGRSIGAGSVNGSAGVSVVIPVSLQARGNENTFGFSLTFDPQLLTYEGAALGSLPAGTSLLMNTNQMAAGKVGVLLALPTGQNLPAGEKVLLQVTLRIAGNLNGAASTLVGFGDSPVVREVVSADVDILPAQYQPGTVSFPPSSLVLGYPNQYVGFTITGMAGQTCRIEWSPVATGGPWSPVTTVTLTSPTQLWVDTSVPVTGNRFYRAVLLP